MSKVEGLPEDVQADDPKAVYSWFVNNTDILDPEEQQAFFEAYLEAYPDQGRRIIVQVVWTTHAVMHPDIDDDLRAKGLFGCTFKDIHKYLIFATT